MRAHASKQRQIRASVDAKRKVRAVFGGLGALIDHRGALRQIDAARNARSETPLKDDFLKIGKDMWTVIEREVD